MKKFIADMGLKRATVHGCSVGIVDTKDVPILKPWTIMTNDPCLQADLNVLRCPGKAEHPVHRECRGVLAKKSEQLHNGVCAGRAGSLAP